MNKKIYISTIGVPLYEMIDCAIKVRDDNIDVSFIGTDDNKSDIIITIFRAADNDYVLECKYINKLNGNDFKYNFTGNPETIMSTLYNYEWTMTNSFCAKFDKEKKSISIEAV